MDAKQHIQQSAAWVDSATLRASLNAAKEGDPDGQRRVAGAMVWAAFSCPDAIEEAEWNKPIEEIRESYGIPIYQSVLPANLFESVAV